MKLKAQTNTAVQTPAYATIAWPELNLPPADPRTGMTADHINALNEWYAGLQGAVNQRLTAMSAQLESLRTATSSQGQSNRG